MRLLSRLRLPTGGAAPTTEGAEGEIAYHGGTVHVRGASRFFALAKRDDLFVNVVDFGATGDGVTDDTAAITAAITAASSGATVFFPGGRTYRTTAAITVAKPLTIVGTGATIRATAQNVAGIHVTSSDVTIDGIGVEGNGSNVFRSGEAGLRVVGSSATYLQRIRIRNVQVRNSVADGIRLEYVTDVLIQGCDVRDVSYSGYMLISVKRARVANNRVTNVTQAGVTNSYGIAMTDNDNTAAARCSDIAVVGNIVDGVPNWEGIDTHGGQRLTISDNVVTSCDRGIALVVGNAGRLMAPEFCVVSGNVIDATDKGGSTREGISLYGNATSKTSAAVTGNFIRGYSTPYGISDYNWAGSLGPHQQTLVMRRTTSQALTNGTFTVLTFPSGNYTVDANDGYLLTNGQAITVPRTGFYAVSMSAMFANVANATGARALGFRQVGGAFTGHLYHTIGAPAIQPAITISGTIYLYGSVSYEFAAYQNSGAALNMDSTAMSMQLVRLP